MATNITVTAEDTALILLNLQQGYRLYIQDAPMVPPQISTSVAALLAAFRQHPGLSIVHLREDQPDPASYLHYRNPGHAFDSWAAPFQGETVLSKTTIDGFLMTDLHNVLRRGGIRTVVLISYTTNRDISATSISARLRGYNCIVVADATATFGDSDIGLTAAQAWQEALATFSINGILLKSTAMVLSELGTR
ncbi:Isochorismatase hydrolase [Calocera viscosa TUFC12733]|uniref:Isochorismatase hydrolase n=1 Tax=Calocera viscosa (strain TUFC12733) TaxID=1330018 RepID=A0A167QZE2_CALVF|nr:Isochorismatase hydrolase [Calocera viscosa TUFC12733]